MCFSNGVMNMAGYTLPEDVVLPETQIGITSSPAVFALTLGMEKYPFHWFMELQQFDTRENTCPLGEGVLSC